MRIIFFILLATLVFLTPPWVSVIFAIIYTLVWPGYEIIILGAFIDSAFGQSSLSHQPLFTLSATLLVLLSTLAHPYLALFDESTT